MQKKAYWDEEKEIQEVTINLETLYTYDFKNKSLSYLSHECSLEKHYIGYQKYD